MESAKIVSRHFSALTKQFPDAVEKFLTEKSLCFEYGRFQVPVNFFQGRENGPVAMLCDEAMDWEAASDDDVQKFWLRHNPELQETLHGSSEAQVTAVSKFVAVESPLRTGPQSFLSSLLSTNRTTDMFQSESVEALVQWKWQLSAGKLHYTISAIHAISSFLFLGIAANSFARVGGSKALGLGIWCTLFLSFLLSECVVIRSASPRSR